MKMLSGRGSRTDTDDRPEAFRETAGNSTPPSDGGHVVMENAPGSHFRRHEYIKGAKRRRDHDEEVARQDHLGMVVDKGQPTLIRIGCSRKQVLRGQRCTGTYRRDQQRTQVQEGDTRSAVRKQGRRAARKINRFDMNAQDRTLQGLTDFNPVTELSFCGSRGHVPLSRGQRETAADRIGEGHHLLRVQREEFQSRRPRPSP